MKNIHLIPTDKRSILSDCVNYKHVYITSDEEIKGGDWCLDTFNSSVYVATKVVLHNIKSLEYEKYIKKIILTTDQDLIADGVQSIDDEFLEWFVKNPSCESVEIQRVLIMDSIAPKNLYEYKIIIPQEEPKQEIKNDISVSSRIEHITDKEQLKIIEFIIDYSFRDKKEIYTNGTILVPLFRVLDAISQKGEPYQSS
jgi:hypothetical protein